jgi:folate-dependent phosphoribosylglycinamide formyltransferase PurN
MRIVLFISGGSYFGEILALHFINAFPDFRFLVIRATSIFPNQSLWRTLRKIQRQSGLRYILQQGKVKLALAVLRMFLFDPFNQLKKVKNARVVSTSAVNDVNIVSEITDFAPDLLASLLFGQIIDNKILQQASMGGVNLHYSYLPSYGGIEPVFWALLYDEDKIGYSFHRLEKKVDKGEILQRVYVSTTGKESVFRLKARLTFSSVNALIELVKDMGSSGFKTVSSDSGEASYFSWPSKQDVRRFYRSGYRHIRFWKDLHFLHKRLETIKSMKPPVNEK